MTSTYKEDENRLLELKYRNMTDKELFCCVLKEAEKDNADPLMKVLSSRFNNILYELRKKQ